MKLCKYQMHLINQGIHWCNKQVEEYPTCCGENCPYYENIDYGELYSTSTDTFDEEIFIKEEGNESSS